MTLRVPIPEPLPLGDNWALCQSEKREKPLLNIIQFKMVRIAPNYGIYGREQPLTTSGE
jgi:hypothetical protein